MGKGKIRLEIAGIEVFVDSFDKAATVKTLEDKCKSVDEEIKKVKETLKPLEKQKKGLLRAIKAVKEG